MAGRLLERPYDASRATSSQVMASDPSKPFRRLNLQHARRSDPGQRGLHHAHARSGNGRPLELDHNVGTRPTFDGGSLTDRNLPALLLRRPDAGTHRGGISVARARGKANSTTPSAEAANPARCRTGADVLPAARFTLRIAMSLSAGKLKHIKALSNDEGHHRGGCDGSAGQPAEVDRVGQGRRRESRDAGDDVGVQDRSDARVDAACLGHSARSRVWPGCRQGAVVERRPAAGL